MSRYSHSVSACVLHAATDEGACHIAVTASFATSTEEPFKAGFTAANDNGSNRHTTCHRGDHPQNAQDPEMEAEAGTSATLLEVTPYTGRDHALSLLVAVPASVQKVDEERQWLAG